MLANLSLRDTYFHLLQSINRNVELTWEGVQRVANCLASTHPKGTSDTSSPSPLASDIPFELRKEDYPKAHKWWEQVPWNTLKGKVKIGRAHV